MIQGRLRARLDVRVGRRREGQEMQGVSTPAGGEAEVRTCRIVGAVALLGRLVDDPVAADRRAGAVARAGPGAGGMIGAVALLLLPRLVHQPVPTTRLRGRVSLHESQRVPDHAVLADHLLE